MSRSCEAAESASSFFERLDSMSPWVRLLLGQGPLSVALDIRAEPVCRILIDATSDRVRITKMTTATPTALRVAADASVWVDVLSGRVAPGEAYGRRELLLRGSASDLARLIPLLELAPPLFRDHLSARIPSSQEAPVMTTNRRSVASLLDKPRSALGRLASTGLHRAAFWTGYSLGRLRRGGLDRAALMELLTSAAQGWERAEVPEPPRPTRESAS